MTRCNKDIKMRDILKETTECFLLVNLKRLTSYFYDNHLTAYYENSKASQRLQKVDAGTKIVFGLFSKDDFFRNWSIENTFHEFGITEVEFKNLDAEVLNNWCSVIMLTLITACTFLQELKMKEECFELLFRSIQSFIIAILSDDRDLVMCLVYDTESNKHCPQLFSVTENNFIAVPIDFISTIDFFIEEVKTRYVNPCAYTPQTSGFLH